MTDVIEDITYRDQSMPMPASLEARVFLPGLSRHRRSSVSQCRLQGSYNTMMIRTLLLLSVFQASAVM